MAAMWEMLDRQQVKDDILHAARNNLFRFKNKDSEKRRWNTAVVTGATGSGKMRLCHDSFV
jgi:hypothetical protein